MKFKALAAAVALLSTATVAQAEWHDGNDDATATGNGELLLVAFDDVRKVSVVQDLGGSYVEFFNNFNSAYNFSSNLDPLFASTFAGSNAADIQWSVYANNYGYADAEGYNEPARFSQGFMVTSNSTNVTIDRSIGNDFSHQDKISGALTVAVNSQLSGDGDYSANDAFYGDAANGQYAGAQAYYGSDLLATVTFNVTGLSTESLYFWNLLTSQASNGELAGADIKALGQWNLDLAGGTVSYSAVPVPAAVWLLASGLLGLGAVSRRRKA